MKKLKLALLILLVAAVFAADMYITHNNFIVNSDMFIQNDFEITQHDHPQKVWDKVFFGNSVVISAYMEDKSRSGYINCGLDYGVVTDLRDMLYKRYINVGSELVIGLNYLTLYDDFSTNPTYIWHKKWYQPYAYFERDRFYPLITEMYKRLLNGESVPPMRYTYQNKAVYHGRVSAAALSEKFEEYREEFFNQPVDKYSENLEALEDVIAFCQRKSIRLRAVWMPWNPMFKEPELVRQVRAAADAIFNENNIEIIDLENQFGSDMFYDTGHLNYDVGAEQFTELIDTLL